MKTPEEMAEEYADLCVSDAYYAPLKAGFLAGYEAAQEQPATKKVTDDYIETASNEAKELIAKFELKGDEDVFVKALVAAYCRGVDAVDGYLRNSLSAYRASVKSQQWISVKDRLPEINKGFIGFAENKEVCNCYRYPDHFEDGRPVFYAQTKTGPLICGLESISHWMELPALPKEEK